MIVTETKCERCGKTFEQELGHGERGKNKCPECMEIFFKAIRGEL